MRDSSDAAGRADRVEADLEPAPVASRSEARSNALSTLNRVSRAVEGGLMRPAVSGLFVLGLTVLAGAQVSAPTTSLSFEVVENSGGAMVKSLHLSADGIDLVAEGAVAADNVFTLSNATLTVSPSIRRQARVRTTFKGVDVKDLPPQILK